jgi:hypothetical protein
VLHIRGGSGRRLRRCFDGHVIEDEGGVAGGGFALLGGHRGDEDAVFVVVALDLPLLGRGAEIGPQPGTVDLRRRRGAA